MYHYYGEVKDKPGNGQAGAFVEVINPSTGVVVPIYSDDGITPIFNVSGVANRAKTDYLGNFDLFVPDGVYTLNYYTSAGVPVRTQIGVPLGNLTGPGVLVASTWKAFTGLPRLKLTGVGTVSIDANTATNGSGTTTSAVYTATVSALTIDFPFFGNDAVAVRATYTGTAAAEII